MSKVHDGFLAGDGSAQLIYMDSRWLFAMEEGKTYDFLKDVMGMTLPDPMSFDYEMAEAEWAKVVCAPPNLESADDFVKGVQLTASAINAFLPESVSHSLCVFSLTLTTAPHQLSHRTGPDRTTPHHIASHRTKLHLTILHHNTPHFTPRTLPH